MPNKMYVQLLEKVHNDMRVLGAAWVDLNEKIVVPVDSPGEYTGVMISRDETMRGRIYWFPEARVVDRGDEVNIRLTNIEEFARWLSEGGAT